MLFGTVFGRLICGFMNFKGMPELQWGFSYYAFIVFSIVIVTVEIVVFKKKKWF